MSRAETPQFLSEEKLVDIIEIVRKQIPGVGEVLAAVNFQNIQNPKIDSKDDYLAVYEEGYFWLCFYTGEEGKDLDVRGEVGGRGCKVYYKFDQESGDYRLKTISVDAEGIQAPSGWESFIFDVNWKQEGPKLGYFDGYGQHPELNEELASIFRFEVDESGKATLTAPGYHKLNGFSLKVPLFLHPEKSN